MPTSARLRGALAALLLAATTIGLPLALAATIGDPLHAWPSLSAGQLSDTDVTAILAAVFWLAWASFALPVLVEITTTVATQVRHRPHRPVRLPLLGAQQDLARHLIAAVLLLLPVASATVAAKALPATHYPSTEPPGVTAAAWTTPTGHAAALTADPHHDALDTRGGPHAGVPRTYLIPESGGMRSYWALAEHYLGDGTRWREIWQLNEGRVHTDGTVMDTPRQLHAGWTILLPPDAGHHHAADPPLVTTHSVTVHPGDTLSGIAAADGITDWRKVWEVNADREEPDHARLTDPDLIYPGWSITLPDSSARPSNLPPTSNGPATSRSAPSPDRRSEPQHQHHARGNDGPVVPPAAPAERDRTNLPTAPPTRALTAPSSRPASPHTTGNARQRPAHHGLPVVPLEIGLAAAASVAALDRARRIAQRRRRIGHRTPPFPAPIRQIEADMRNDARDTHPAVAAIELASALTATAPVTIRTVIARDNGAIDLHLDPSTATAAPPPFVAIPAGWQLPADASGFTFAVDEVDEPAPILTPVGRLPDADVLVNLAHAGPVSIAGDPATVTRYLTQLGAALIAAPWAGRVHLHVPTELDDQLGDNERVTVDQPSPVLPAPLPQAPTGAEEPGWCTTPIYLYLGWTDTDDIEPLLRAATDPNTTIHAVLNGPCENTTVWTLDGDALTLPDLDQPVTVTVPDPDAPTAADLVAYTANAVDLPIGDPRLSDPAMDAPPDPRTTSRQLNLLGPVELAGLDTPRRTQPLNLLTYLALHRHGADHDTLDTILWRHRVSGKTLRNRVLEARALVGGAITEGPIWRLTDAVTTDLQRFLALAAGTPNEQHEALRLIRGRPFEGLDYADWIDLEGIRSNVEATIVDLALTVAHRDLADGDPNAALAAARAGLAASRYDERLHRLAIHAATAAGHTSVVTTLKAEMRTAIEDDIEPDDTLQPETLELYADLRRAQHGGQ